MEIKKNIVAGRADYEYAHTGPGITTFFFHVVWARSKIKLLIPSYMQVSWFGNSYRKLLVDQNQPL